MVVGCGCCPCLTAKVNISIIIKIIDEFLSIIGTISLESERSSIILVIVAVLLTVGAPTIAL